MKIEASTADRASPARRQSPYRTEWLDLSCARLGAPLGRDHAEREVNDHGDHRRDDDQRGRDSV